MQGLFKPPEAKRAEHRHFHDYDQNLIPIEILKGANNSNIITG